MEQRINAATKLFFVVQSCKNKKQLHTARNMMQMYKQKYSKLEGIHKSAYNRKHVELYKLHAA